MGNIKEANFCSNCGAQNTAKNKFCSKCGSRIHSPEKKTESQTDKITCPNCGNINNKSAKFCAACSAPLISDFTLIDEVDYVYIKINLKEIDFENSKDLSPLTKKISNQNIIVDLSDVVWIDSSGIGALITMVHKFSRSQQEIKFLGINPKIMAAIKSLQADNVLDINDNLNEILVSWGLPPI
ncbi:MAG TPA: zinc ribbon domain-containing protein [bacterium]|nr:zinc ribbon domain-containing protein [bacterium]